MGEKIKGFAWVLITFGGLFVVMEILSPEIGGNNNLLMIGILAIFLAIPLLFFGGFCKIAEDTRDSLYRIEELLEKDKTEE